jgi:hypothetical protein
MKDVELKRLRDQALYVVYKEGLESGSFNSMRAAAEYVCRHPAPRFFVSAESASALVGNILSGVSLIFLHPAHRRMVWRLFRDYQSYLSDNPGCSLPRLHIMEILVERPAPEFYIEPQAARKRLQVIINEKRKAWRG